MRAANGKKKCSKCGEVKNIDSFYKSKQKNDGLDVWCKRCKLLNNKIHNSKPDIAAIKKEYHQKHHLKNRSIHLLQSKRNNIKLKYGITLEEYEGILFYQKSSCKICGVHISGRNAHIDHCHETGRIRGFLCPDCNRGLGFFKDSTDLLSKAIKYLHTDDLVTLCKACHEAENDRPER